MNTALADVFDSADASIMGGNAFSNNGGSYITFTENVSHYIGSTDEAAAPAASRAGSSYDIRYDYSYKTYKTGVKTEFVYQGNILTGDCDYRCTGYYRDTNRMSYNFANGTLLTTMETTLTWLFSSAKAGVSGLVLSLLKAFGIEYVEGKILQNFNPTVAIRSFDFKFRTKMKPATTSIAICILDRQIDYVHAQVNGQDNLTGVDMATYATEASAISGMCSESLSYAARAFEAKYITQTYPDLSLPVYGPSNTWD